MDNEDDREEIAQITVNRLIFIKFLETINIIRGEVLEYLRNLEEHNLNLKLFQLFFEVMNTKKENRGSIDPRFADIPYLNGSLFEPLEVERKHQQYRIKAEILKRIIDFLGRFRFARYESLDGEDESIDPEILGYIFERSMTAKDRKGTGAYYTPREITKYIAKNCIYPIILEKSNYFLEKNRGYKKSELLSSVDEILILPATSQKVILNDIILKLTVCDNACGSGSFLLAAANVLFELARNVNDNLGTPFTDIYLKKQILRSLYGVDINSRAVEIAHLRLWLWLIESYTSDYIEPLPNIEYNLEVGNSLIGYVDMEAFGKTKVTLDDFTGSEESAKLLLSRFVDLKSTYGAAFGNEARKLRERIEDVRDKLQRQLDREAYIEISHKLGIDINRQEFLRLKPFHYGFEFYEIFDLELPKFERGFDVVIGNPPYVDSEEMVKNQQKFRDILSETYDSAVGNWDLYVPFFERAMQITTVGGIVCFISPNKWLSIGYGESLRHMFAKQLIRLCNCDEIDVFQDADNSPVISFFKKQDLSSEVMVDYFRADYQVIAMSPAPRKILELDNWGILISKYINTLLIILNQKHQLAPEYCDVENPFTVSEAYELAKLVYDGKANEKEFKLINTGTIDRFQSLWGKKTTSYIKRKYKYPYVRKAEFKKLMPKRFEQSSSPKLIITGIRYFESFLDEDGSHVAGKSTIIIRNPKKANLKALNALLNSKLIGFYMREAFRTAGIQGGVNFSSSMVEIIPVPNLTASHISNLTKLHDKMVGYIENQYSIAISRTD
ncbi:MAG TPA: DNA methyltransferase, partial [Nitrososphaera sp.]|nr:DNA methyltransferase [Nitrososphaera sp.]